MKKIILTILIVYSIYVSMLVATDGVPLLAVLSSVDPMMGDTFSFGDPSRGGNVSITQMTSDIVNNKNELDLTGVDIQLKSFHLATSKHIDSGDGVYLVIYGALTALMLFTSSIVDEKCQARYPLWTDTFLDGGEFYEL